MVGIIFIVGCIAFYFYTKHESKVERLERNIEKLKNEKARLKIDKNLKKQSTILVDDEDEQFIDGGYTSVNQYNHAIDEIVKSAKYSPIERIYYEAQLPDQLSNDISLKEKTQEHLDYLESKGVNQNDIIAAKEILRMREDISGRKLDFEGFVLETINFKDKYVTKEIYLGLIKIYETAGRDITISTTTLYNRLFLDLPF
ncbi:hypothetical protein GCM10022291_24770 [Postechiella marina]|uniref:Uncharacterized protein n=1 Tax=Postechiella marina TaxID=943941 RepID=A0ABP8CCG4_9FLAO